MADRIAHDAAGGQTAAEAVARARLFTPLRMRSRPMRISSSEMTSGGSSRTTLSPAGTESTFWSRSAAADLGVGRHALEAEHQADAANVLDDLGELVGDRREALLHQQALAADLVEEAVVEHHVEHGVADRHGQRIAAEGGAVDAGGHADRRSVGRKAGAHREAAADALGDRHQVGLDAGPFIGEQLAGPADAALHLVEDQQQAMLVAELAQPLQRLRGEWPDAALALHRLDQDRGGFRGDRLGGGVDVVERHLVEAVDLGAETFEIFLLAAGGDRRQRAAVEGAFEGDGAVALGMAVDVVIAARGLDRAFQRLGAGIGEEDLVGEGVFDQPLGEPALARDLVEIGDVPELAGLLGQRRDQMRMAVAERIDGDAAGEVEISLAIGLDQPDTLAPLESQGGARKGLVKRRTAHYLTLRARSPGCSQAYARVQPPRPREKSKKPPKRRPLSLYPGFRP